MNEKELEKALKALANKRRLAILKLLKKSKSAHVTEIATVIKLSLKATSKHLTIMTAAGLVEGEQRGANVVYVLREDLSNVAKYILNIL